MKASVVLSVAVCLFGNVLAQAAVDQAEPSVGHKKMLEWCGQATIAGKTYTTPLGPGRAIKGTWIGKPILDGFVVEGAYHYQGKGPSGETRAREIISYDPATDKYHYAFYCDNGYVELSPFTVKGTVASWEGTSVKAGKEYKFRGSDADLADGTGFLRKEEISVDGRPWQLLMEARFVFDQTDTSNAEQELIRLQHEWSRAEVAGDVDAVDRLLADEYVLTAFDGTTITKAQLLRDVASEDTRLIAMAIENCKVRLYEDMAVVKGVCKWTEASGKKHETLFTEPWLKRDGRWQCLTTHESKVEPGMADTPPSSPAMERLKAGVGEWAFEGQLSNPQIEDLPLPPPVAYSGTAASRFILDGAFLETELTVKVGEMVVMQEVTLTGYDADADHYIEHTFTRDGDSDTSTLTVPPDGKTWTSRSTMTTDQGKDVLARIVTEFSEDGDSNMTVMELSEDDGKTWKLLFKHEGKKAG